MLEIKITDFRNPANITRTALLNSANESLTKEQIKGLLIFAKRDLDISFTDEEKLSIIKIGERGVEISITGDLRTKLESIVEKYNSFRTKPNLGEIYQKSETERKEIEQAESDIRVAAAQVREKPVLPQENTESKDKKLSPEERRKRGAENLKKNKNEIGTDGVTLKPINTSKIPGYVEVDENKINELRTSTYQGLTRETMSTKSLTSLESLKSRSSEKSI